MIIVAKENAKLKLLKVLSSYKNALRDISKLFLQQLTLDTWGLWIFSSKCDVNLRSQIWNVTAVLHCYVKVVLHWNVKVVLHWNVTVVLHCYVKVVLHWNKHKSPKADATIRARS